MLCAAFFQRRRNQKPNKKTNEKRENKHLAPSAAASLPRDRRPALRVVEHNVLVIGAYYSRIRLPRLAALLDLPVADAERHLSELVVAKALPAKIDRPAGVVALGAPRGAEGVLNAWSTNISKLLSLVETATQQIQKEAMVHKVTLGGGASATA